MKMPPILPAAFCVVAGLLLSGEAIRQVLSGEKFDVFFFGVGLYFMGKGLFVYNILAMLREFKNNR
jgi:hypothetical protein